MRASRRWTLLLAGAAACVNNVDQRSHVHDLRVLGVQLEPPELMLMVDGGCDLANPQGLFAQALLVWTQPVTYRALIADPEMHSEISYALTACADPNDLTCADGGVDLLAQESHQTDAGAGLDTELTLSIKPGLATNADGGFLLFDVFQDDPFHGLGGLRMPLMLHLSTTDGEEVYAQKLMTFSCQFFPDMTPDQNPVLQGFTIGDAGWPEDAGVIVPVPDGGCPDAGLCAVGAGTLPVQATGIADAGAPYSVVAFDLSEVHLTESWVIDWYTTLGSFSPDETGGINVDGQQDPQSTEWSTGTAQPEQDVYFWFVVRNGRGGESWQKRFLHYIP
jgi:hypothetical protein